MAAGAGVARENIKIFTTETFSEVAPDAFLTLLFSKYAGRRPGNAQDTQLLEHVGTCWNLFQGNIRKLPVCTAQGGGGSFKDRKPIGEVRCCESWMAEQTH